MNLKEFNEHFHLISNIAVLLGIVFLGYELQQNNIVAKAQIRNEIANAANFNISANLSPEGLAIRGKRSRE
ncbi:MAG: hypothetical protein O2971_14790 [Proteobacteria bacterium]|nr:hypothetical protein [Pseudomonadota bacterium]